MLARLIGLRSGTSMPALWLCWGRVQRRDNGLCPLVSLEESSPPALTLMPDTSVPLCMPLLPFKLLPQCWSSEGVNMSKSMCGFSKRSCFGLQGFLPLTQSPLFFFFLQPEIMGIYLPGTGTWAGGPHMGLGLLSPEISLPNFYPHTYVALGPASSLSLPLLPVCIDVVSLIL